MATLTVAYVLWFFGGWFGLHHVYLKRDRQAFVWWSTLGGVLGLGWIRDIWRMPDYVKECNEDEVNYKNNDAVNDGSQTNADNSGTRRDFATNSSTTNSAGESGSSKILESTIHTQGTSETHSGREGDVRISPDDGRSRVTADVPKWNHVRFAGELLVGNIFSYLFRLAVPEEYAKLMEWPMLLLPPIGAAVGTHLVANIGRERCSWKWPLIGAFTALPWLGYNIENIASSPLISTLFTNWWGRKRRTEPRPRRGLCKRLTILSCCGLGYLLLLTSTIYLNASVTINDNESVPLREAIYNFFKSPAWAETKEQVIRLYNYYQANGWNKIWDEIIAALDPAGEANAYKVLDLDKNASQEEITKQYKTLARKWHPDRHKDPKQKLEAQEKFIEIQQAYDILSQIRAKRTKRSKESTVNERTEF